MGIHAQGQGCRKEAVNAESFSKIAVITVILEKTGRKPNPHSCLHHVDKAPKRKVAHILHQNSLKPNSGIAVAFTCLMSGLFPRLAASMCQNQTRLAERDSFQGLLCEHSAQAGVGLGYGTPRNSRQKCRGPGGSTAKTPADMGAQQRS